MKRVVIFSLVCVLSFFQYSWGYQAEAEDSSGGLVEVLVDIVTAPCSLLAVCLGTDGGQPCTCPHKRRLSCVPVKKRCRPPRTSTGIRKVPTPGVSKRPPGQPPQTSTGVRKAPTPGVSERPPGLPPQTPSSAPPVTTQKEIPPQRELLVPGTPTDRPKLPDILPGPSEPMPPPASPKQPTPSEQKRTTVPQEPSLAKTPGRVPVPPTPGVSETPPATPKTGKSEKQPKPGKSRQWAPCVPVYPPTPCMPFRPPAPCGPRLFPR